MRVLLQALLAATAATAPALPDNKPPAPETVSISRDSAQRVTMLTQINGRGPYPFTVDTAADRSVISDQLVQQLGLASADGATVFGIAGPFAVATAEVGALRIGKRDHQVGQIPVLPAAALGAPGLIGLDALENESVVFDFPNHRATIAHIAGDAMLRDPATIRVRARDWFGHLIVTDASVNGVKVYAILDTGAENTIGNLALRRLLGRSGPLQGKGAEIIGVTGASLPVEPSQVPHLRLGALTLINMPVAYGDIATFHRFQLDQRPAILIGMDVLRGFERVAVDFKRREVRFHLADQQLFRFSNAGAT